MDDSFLLIAMGMLAVLLLPIMVVGLADGRSHRRQRALAVRSKEKHRL